GDTVHTFGWNVASPKCFEHQSACASVQTGVDERAVEPGGDFQQPHRLYEFRGIHVMSRKRCSSKDNGAFIDYTERSKVGTLKSIKCLRMHLGRFTGGHDRIIQDDQSAHPVRGVR